MRLSLPGHITPTWASAPREPRKFNKILSSLPGSTLSELTEHGFQASHNLKWRPLPDKPRWQQTELAGSTN